MAEMKIVRVRGFRKKTGTYVEPFTRVIKGRIMRISPIFGKSIKIQRGALGGWHASSPASERQAILMRIALREGYRAVVKRLVFLKNISNVKRVDAAVNEDLAWLRKKFLGK
jgi:hypothetical protein